MYHGWEECPVLQEEARLLSELLPWPPSSRPAALADPARPHTHPHASYGRQLIPGSYSLRTDNRVSKVGHGPLQLEP